MSSTLSAAFNSSSPAGLGHADERSLDPQDWDAMRALGHRMIDDVMTYMQSIRERPVWQKPSAEAIAAYAAPMPMTPTSPEQIYDEYLEHVLPFVMGNGHPRFWGWVTGTGTPIGVLADLLASGANVHAAFGDQSATHIERQVIGWFTSMFGMPATAGGLLVSSGSTANLTGLTAARDVMVPEFMEEGGASIAAAPCVVYASREVHNSVDKAIGSLGLGRRNLRRIDVDADYRIVPAALERAIAEDRAAGRRPICIIATAGTVNTGAVDDLEALSDIAKREKLWLHVDGAFGASLIVSSKFRHLLRGIEHADSIAFDFHKWFYVPYDVGCTLVRNESHLRGSFSPPASYLAKLDRGIVGGGVAYGGLGADLSRRFRALKVWMSFKEHGADRYGEQIEQNVAQAAYLASLIEREPNLELAAPVPLNVVCFRFAPAGVEGEDKDALNREILMRLQERGIAAPSSTVLDGRFAIRVAITNHRSTRADFDTLVSAVLEIGRELKA
ncbi:MAG TPA: aspartate aminotransferase family protein [Gemmatimonadaceae bacterium]|nr:aspartate aminotransferase family protein [Gemmatimonadaceae bacterium]